MKLSAIQLNKQKKILIVVFLVLIVYLESGYILKAQRSGITRQERKITKIKSDLINLEHGLENMRAFKNNPGQAKQKSVIKSSRILPEKQISELLQEISNAANKFDIRISQMRPMRQAQKGKPAVGQEKFIPFSIHLDLIADYHNLGRFIQALEESPIFMGVQGLEISIQSSDYMKQKVLLVLKTYVAK